MAWPFGTRKPAPTATQPAAPAVTAEDEAVLQDVRRWLTKHLPGTPVHRPDDQPVLHLGAPNPTIRTESPAPAGAVLKMKKGKLAWIDLYDPALREPLNALIKELDKRQKWYFNGVVSTKYEEPKPKGGA